MALQVASIGGGTASLVESPVFGKKDQGNVDVQRVAFAGFNDLAHKVPVLTDEPADASSYVPLIVTNLQNEPMAIWVEKEPFEVRFSNTPEELAVLKKSRICHAEYVAAKVQNAIGAILPPNELEKAISAAALETDTALHKVSRQKTGLQRAMIVGGEQQFYLLTRNKMLGDEIVADGTYKTAKYVVDLVTGDVHVVAVCHKNELDSITWENVEHEAAMMQMLADVPNVVRLYAYLKTDEKIYFIMENCSGGTLLDANFNPQTPLTEPELLQIAQELSSGLVGIHAKNIVHSDLKPDNIFLTKDKHARIGDFGCSFLNSDLKRRLSIEGTMRYISPELFGADDGSDPAIRRTVAIPAANIDKADVWSLGIVFFQLFKGAHPWSMGDCLATRLYVRELIQVQVDQVIDDAELSPALTIALKGMLQVNPALRWMAEEVQMAMFDL